MRPVASRTSAALAGAWAVLGLIPFEFWMDDHSPDSVVAHNVLWLAALAVFLFVPFYFFVIGRSPTFSRTWFLDGEERKAYGAIVRRVLVWFLSAGVCGSIWSILFSLAVRRARWGA